MLVMTMVVALSMSMVGAAVASAHMLASFTQTELDDNWVANRQFPRGDVTSVTAHGRSAVAAIGVVGAERDANSNKWFEGIKKVDDFGPAVQVDLYVPAEWGRGARRAYGPRSARHRARRRAGGRRRAGELGLA